MASNPRMVTVDGNEAAASVAYRLNEVIAIYPITPSSTMGELADAWSAEGRPNVWGDVPDVVEMQSEGGAAGAVHGALQAGALTTTFTSSQGLLLMIPNLYKIAGELTACCMHVAARAIATHALSIFGDHSDVMAARQTGWAQLAASSVQEVHDFACIAAAATLAARVPFMHFFDGFRTSHEVAKIAALSDDDLRWMIDPALVAAHRSRALTPDRPRMRGTAQNPDVFFQAREACNPFYARCPALVQAAMDRFAARTGRPYRLFEYTGHPAADRVLVLMGSGAETARETAAHLAERGERVGVITVHLYRPFAMMEFVAALPPTARAIAVLDRTKEPGGPGEPLYLDVLAALAEAAPAAAPRVVGGRYGLASKEFTPAMVQSVFDELAAARPRNHFTVGINDDCTHTSLAVERELDLESPDEVRAVFYGLGSDGTVGANKNSIKIIGEQTDRFAQGYFVYDSKKSGALTISHLRFGPRPIHAPYLIRHAGFVACHQMELLDRVDVLELLEPHGTFLLNTSAPPETVWDRLPVEMQAALIAKQARFYVIDAYHVAREARLGGRINTIMQTCFFAIAGVLPTAEAIAHIGDAIEKTYAKAGAEVIARNHAAVERALAHVHEVAVPAAVTSERHRAPVVSDRAPEFVQHVTAAMLAGRGDALPVSAFPVDGTWPTGTAQWEKRNLAREIPVWSPANCIQCNQCVLVCPHAAIRAKVYDPAAAAGAPEGFVTTPYRAPDLKGSAYTIQVAPEDCTGCRLCIVACPANDKADAALHPLVMAPQEPRREHDRAAYEFFATLPELERTALPRVDAKCTQFLQPLFEFSGACAGCGETPYIKLLTQLFGDRLLIANATGCSSIYGGNLPTTPYTVDAACRGPAWSNSLFEDNAEFGYGFRLAVDAQRAQAVRLLEAMRAAVGDELVAALLAEQGHDERAIRAQRERVALLRERLAHLPDPRAALLATLADYLVRKSVWLVGGDGWAYDIGYGGLDHVLAQRRDINVLVLDTEVYSNTGGQQSKATPLGATAKFASAGKGTAKKDLGLAMMSYGHIYVARIALGAKVNQTVHALAEADAYPGPSLVIAYSHCIAHGYDLRDGTTQQKLAVNSGVWPLYRFDPRRSEQGLPPLQLDCGPPTVPAHEYMEHESRFGALERRDPARFHALAAAADREAAERFALYRQLAEMSLTGAKPPGEPSGR
jgi:pyruvate-ferredoxin/flavodoxin oxidoreductase